jgi:hypothetical protein
VGAGFLEAGGESNDGVGAVLIGGGALVMVASYTSGGIGYFRIKRCREAIAEFERAHPP